MNEQTYTATGRIDLSQDQLILNIALPDPPSRNIISTTYYNLSKKSQTTGQQINVVLCEFTFDKDPGVALPTPTNDEYQTTVHISTIVKSPRLPGVQDFDFSSNTDCLFLFFHSTEANADDREAFFDDLENLYARAVGGPYVTIAPVLHGKPMRGKPRYVGGVIVN
jgi:hypothetical protein